MAARAIVGIALGIFFAPIIYMLLSGTFMTWIGLITSDFNAWGMGWIYGNPIPALPAEFMTAPITIVITGVMDFNTFMSTFALVMFTWIIIGMWAGSIERSAGRGVGVAAGIWLGWLIIYVIVLAVMGGLGGILTMLEWTFFTLILAIIMAALFGAITKSEEF